MKVIERTSIEYKGKSYPAVFVQPGKESDGMVLVSVESLEDAVYPYTDAESKRIDNEIYFYTMDANIYRDDLAEILREETDWE